MNINLHSPLRKRIAFITAFLLITALFATFNVFYSVKINTSTTLAAAAEQAPGTIDIWWPVDTTHLVGTVPFKALLNGHALGDYSMYWKVDGGGEVSMGDSQTDYPHKEASVDVTNWNWKGAGAYTVTFVAKDSTGQVISERSVQIYTGNAQTQSPNSTTPSDLQSQASTSPDTTAANAPAQASTPAPLLTVSHPIMGTNITISAPTDNQILSGLTTFRAALDQTDGSNYKMFWSVDGGIKNEMPTAFTDGTHKEASVDLTNWKWNSSGMYGITFTAQDLNGKTITEKIITIHVSTPPSSNTANMASAPSPSPSPLPISKTAEIKTISKTQTDSTAINLAQTMPVSPVTQANTSNLYVSETSNAKTQANAWRTSRPADAALMDMIASRPVATWFGNWTSDIKSAASQLVSAAASKNSVPVMVAYNIPQRDCGSYSAGGANNADGYKQWINSLKDGIGNNKAIVILEPDALAGMDCLNQSDQATRLSLLNYAVSALKSNAGTKVYIDGGNTTWHPADVMATRLGQAGIKNADGFSLNVSNFAATSENVSFGQQISGKLGGAHFVVDTSRNGNGSDGQWCNPSGRGLGNKPTTSTGNGVVDAYLWLKTPGESDGQCNGGPSAGQWWPEYALGLAQNAHL